MNQIINTHQFWIWCRGFLKKLKFVECVELKKDRKSTIYHFLIHMFMSRASFFSQKYVMTITSESFRYEFVIQVVRINKAYILSKRLINDDNNKIG